jgi:hypothetical protein
MKQYDLDFDGGSGWTITYDSPTIYCHNCGGGLRNQELFRFIKILITPITS